MKFDARLYQRTETAMMPGVVTLLFNPLGNGLPNQLSLTVATADGATMVVGGLYQFSAELITEAPAAIDSSDGQG